MGYTIEIYTDVVVITVGAFGSPEILAHADDVASNRGIAHKPFGSHEDARAWLGAVHDSAPG